MDVICHIQNFNIGNNQRAITFFGPKSKKNIMIL